MKDVSFAQSDLFVNVKPQAEPERTRKGVKTVGLAAFLGTFVAVDKSTP